MVLARRLMLAWGGLAALSGSMAFFSVQMGLTGSSEKLRNLGGIVFVVMGVLSFIFVLLFWRSLSHSLRRVLWQLHEFEKTNEIGMIMIDADDELAELVAGINRHLTNVNSRFADSHLQHKELKIQALAAEAERQQIEAIIYSISEGVLVTDRHDELLLANQAAEELLRFKLETHHRLPIDQVIGDPEFLDLIAKTRQDKDRKVTRLLESTGGENGATLSLRVFLSCVFDKQEEVVGVVVVIHDVTREQELARMKDDFANSVSHELKTPLSSICAYAEMLMDNEAHNDQDRRVCYTVIQEQGRRLTRLVDDILHISRIDSGVMQAAQERLNLALIIDDVILAMEPQAREKGIRLCRHLEDEVLAVWADREMMYQALINLVSNAVKYSYADRDVQIRAGYDGNNGQVVVEVEDQGAGIPPECLGHIFDKFYRVGRNKVLAGGTGLGLNLVKKIVEEVHGGRVEVSSVLDQGSRFTLILPNRKNQISTPVE